jgi:hypothetical protein
MFIGAIPKPFAQQIVSHIDLDRWGSVFIGCSGSFRIEQAIRFKYPDVMICSNDVSLLSCIIGGGRTGALPDVQFCGALEPLDVLIDHLRPEDLLAAVGVALMLSKLQGNNSYCNTRRAHVFQHAADYIQANRTKAKVFLDSVKIDRFYPGDFREQIGRAKQAEGGFMAFAPTYKAGYEKIYRYLDENTKWDAPWYELWNPKDFPELVKQCRDTGIPYCIYVDHEVEGERYTMTFRGSGRPVYCYTNDGDSSLRKTTKKTKPFRYTPVQPERINQDSIVEICPVDSAHIAFLKDVYLTKNIDFKDGMTNFLVMIDGKLAGGITITQSQYGDRTREAYILSDFAITRERKVSKLIAMLAASREVIEYINRAWFAQIETIKTTAFTDKPVSMKYRGIFTLHSRKPGILNYAAAASGNAAQELFNLWYAKYAKN